MTSLREIQRSFFTAVHDGDDAPLLASVAPGLRSKSEQIATYRSAYWSRLVDALRDDFPSVVRMLGESLFEHVAVTHIKRCPSREPSLAFLGRGFDQTLTDLGLTGEASIARLEFARVEAFWSPDAPHSGWDIGHFGERFGDAILRFDPSVRIVASSVAREYVVVFRKGHAIAEETIGPLEAAALERALAGERVSKVCEAFLGADEPDVTATATLGKWLRSGWVRALE